MKELESIKKELHGLFESQRLAVLATQNEGQPYTNLVAFAAAKDLKSLFFATTRATRKYANLSADSRVAMLVDSRSNEVLDLKLAMAVTAMGRAEEVEIQAHDQVLQLYLEKHPHLEEFVSSPSCALLRIWVCKYILVTRFQKVMEVSVLL